MKPTAPNVFSTIVPGGMDMEEWAAGGFSKFLHPEKDCTDEVNVAIEKFKSEISSWMVLELPGFTDDTYIIQESLEKLINNYNPKN